MSTEAFITFLAWVAYGVPVVIVVSLGLLGWVFVRTTNDRGDEG